MSIERIGDSADYLDEIRPRYGRIQVAAYIAVLAAGKAYPVLFERNSKKGGFWQGITGGVEAEDLTMRHAIAREVFEETGSEFDISRFIELPPQTRFEFTTPDKGPHLELSFALGISAVELSQLTLSDEHTAFCVGEPEVQIARLSFSDNQTALLSAVDSLITREPVATIEA